MVFENKIICSSKYSTNNYDVGKISPSLCEFSDPVCLVSSFYEPGQISIHSYLWFSLVTNSHNKVSFCVTLFPHWHNIGVLTASKPAPVPEGRSLPWCTACREASHPTALRTQQAPLLFFLLTSSVILNMVPFAQLSHRKCSCYLKASASWCHSEHPIVLKLIFGLSPFCKEWLNLINTMISIILVQLFKNSKIQSGRYLTHSQWIWKTHTMT